MGSSPHSRGTPYCSSSALMCPRIIPAFAGNTRYCRSRSEGPRDHPRIRGEHLHVLHISRLKRGSSPHSRGTLDDRSMFMDYYGIIPAFAGNTMIECFKLNKIWDHPRIRGEHQSSTRSRKKAQGSSPHSRGTLWLATTGIELPGIIPAFAGNTWIVIRIKTGKEDHPRIRGEHQKQEECAELPLGSSPHSRGTH